VPISECFESADFVVAGAHKWLYAYLPMGIGFFGRRRSRSLIERRLQILRRCDRTNDPLLDFTEQLESDDLDSHFETANLAPVFAAAGAVSQSSAVRQSKLSGCFLPSGRRSEPRSATKR
jgi:selenocysteine lyase/cysteine desulfurase